MKSGDPDYGISQTVPGCGTTPKEIFEMYQRGEMFRPKPAYNEGEQLQHVYAPKDQMEVIQASIDFQSNLNQQSADVPSEPSVTPAPTVETPPVENV